MPPADVCCAGGNGSAREWETVLAMVEREVEAGADAQPQSLEGPLSIWQRKIVDESCIHATVSDEDVPEDWPVLFFTFENPDVQRDDEPVDLPRWCVAVAKMGSVDERLWSSHRSDLNSTKGRELTPLLGD